MKVWSCVFSGDEMVSDSYKHELIHNDACLEVQAKFVTKGSDFVAIAGKYIQKMIHHFDTVSCVNYS